MEVWGFEPQTFSMPLRRAPNCATPPYCVEDDCAVIIPAIIQPPLPVVKQTTKMDYAVAPVTRMCINKPLALDVFRFSVN